MFWDMMYLDGEFERKYAYLIQLGEKRANRGKGSFEKRDNFYLTKENLSRIKIIYYYQELYEFFKSLPQDQKFDAIFLSNIYDWLPLKQKEFFAEFIKQDVGERLKENGMVAVYSSPRGYSYETGLNCEFPETIKLAYKDKVLVYRK